MSGILNQIKYAMETHQNAGVIGVGQSLEKIPRSPIWAGNQKYSDKLIKEYLLYLYQHVFKYEDDAEVLSGWINRISGMIDKYYREIQQALDSATDESIGAAISDRSNPENIKTVYYTAKSGYNKDATTARVDGGLIIGEVVNDIVDNNTSGSHIRWKNMTAIITEAGDIFRCVGTKHNGEPLSGEDVVGNIVGGAVITGVSRRPGRKEIEITIDRGDYSSFNGIAIKTRKPYIYTVHTSEDGVYYNRIGQKRILTSSLNLSVDKKKSRYVKITVHMPAHTSESSGGYVYKFEYESLFIHMSQYIKSAIFETNDIELNTIGRYIGIDTCDNYSNRAVSIKYQIKLDDKEWRSISPVRKTSIHQDGLKSLIPISDFVDWKIANIANSKRVGNERIYDVELLNTLIESNDFKFFDRSRLYDDNGAFVTVYGVLYKDVEFDVGDIGIYINGILKTGKVTIYSGINRIDFPSQSFSVLYNIDAVKDVKYAGGGMHHVAGNDGKTYSIQDRSFAINGFSMAIAIFGYRGILGKDISDKIELRNNGANSQIVAPIESGPLFVMSRNRRAKVGKVRLRAIMSCKDRYTRPEISRIMFKIG